MSDPRQVTDEDTGSPRLDADDQPIFELGLDSVDIADDQGTSLNELAAGQRSWRFGHVIVDEAQDLTPMQWRMVTRRARGNSMTVVGDLAQRSIGEPTRWQDLLPREVDDFEYRELTINYRSPSEINEVATRVLAKLAPDLPAPRSIRSSGEEPLFVQVDSVATSLDAMVASEVASLDNSRLAVIGMNINGDFAERVHVIDPWQAKGLEFDVVIVVEPAEILAQANGLSLLFVALTRSTRRLVIIHEDDLPDVLLS